MNHIPSTNEQTSQTRGEPAESANSEHRPLPRDLIYRTDLAEFDADVNELWAMTVPERIAAMRARQLTGTQLTEWSGHRPDQVPRIGGEFGEFEYLVMNTDEYHDNPPAAAVIDFPCPKEVRDVAA